jgi:hypothetical protein
MVLVIVVLKTSVITRVTDSSMTANHNSTRDPHTSNRLSIFVKEG